jgi:anti-sigma regulatory factor (Ser/Thr protein kinase)
MTVPSVPCSVAQLRRFAVQACRDIGPDLRDIVALLVSEVATNALVHGCGEVRLRVLASPGRLRVEVEDGSTVLPQPRQAGPEAEGGRGLALVDALASAWGTQGTVDGKVVWFELVT